MTLKDLLQRGSRFSSEVWGAFVEYHVYIAMHFAQLLYFPLSRSPLVAFKATHIDMPILECFLVIVDSLLISVDGLLATFGSTLLALSEIKGLFSVYLHVEQRMLAHKASEDLEESEEPEDTCASQETGYIAPNRGHEASHISSTIALELQATTSGSAQSPGSYFPSTDIKMDDEDSGYESSSSPQPHWNIRNHVLAWIFRAP